MKYRVTRPSSILDASITLPASKSISNRLLIIHALAQNEDHIENLSDSDDTRVMIDAFSSADMVKDVGHAGTSMRFLCAFYSCREGEVQMTGSARMKERPIGPLVDALRLLGAEINYIEKDGFPPLKIKGKYLEGGEITIDGGISSQFISALLMIAPIMKKGLILHLTGSIVSSSYIEMTLKLMAEYGAGYSWEGNTISVSSGNYEAGGYRVESDWSAASYWYSMAFADRNARIQLSRLKQNSLQGDSALVAIFKELGLESEFDGEELRLEKKAGEEPGYFSYDFTSCPDIVQSMAVALCISNIPFHFSGTQTLRIKETDRILALRTELKKLGYILETDEAGSFLSWNKKRCTPESDPLIGTYHDHRMAMAFAPVALVRESILIDDPMVVSKSYPKFWEDLEKAGFVIDLL